jgi:hypothetical protein
MNVNCLEDSNLINAMVEVEGVMSKGIAPTSSPNNLAMLETLHKVLGLYMWLSCRNPCSFSDHEDVADLKDRVEKALDRSWRACRVEDSMERPMRDKRQDSKIAWTPRKLLQGTLSRISAGGVPCLTSLKTGIYCWRQAEVLKTSALPHVIVYDS